MGQGGREGAGPITPALGDVLFGEDYPPTSTTNEPFLGTADDILVLKRCLDETEVQTLAAEGTDFLQTDEEAGVLYTMEDEQGSILVDRLTGDGAADAALENDTGALPGDCQLIINYSTSAAGSIRVELQQPDGTPLPEFSLENCDLIFGDHVERAVSWNARTELKPLAGTPLKIRFELRDADLYSIQFGRVR